MPWTEVSLDSAAVASGNLTLPTPVGGAAGDVYIATIAIRDTAAFTLPTGWTQIVQNNTGNTSTTPNASIVGGVLAYITRGSSEPSLTFTRTGGNAAIGLLGVYRPPFGIARFDKAASSFLAANNTSIVIGSQASLVDDELIFFTGFIADNAISVDDVDIANYVGGTSSLGDSTTLGADAAIHAGYNTAIFDTGSTGAVTFTFSATSRHGAAVALFYPFRGIEANAGSYSLTGVAVADPTIRLDAVAGSYSLTGQAANLLKASRVTAEAGTYALTGQVANLLKASVVSAEAGVYSLEGVAVELVKSIILLANAGAYSYTGNATILSIIPRWTWTEQSAGEENWAEINTLSAVWVEGGVKLSTWTEQATNPGTWTNAAPAANPWAEND